VISNSLCAANICPGAPAAVTNAVVNMTSNLYLQNATVTCDEGHEFSDGEQEKISRCLDVNNTHIGWSDIGFTECNREFS